MGYDCFYLYVIYYIAATVLKSGMTFHRIEFHILKTSKI